MEQRCAILKQITDDQEIVKEGIFHSKQLEELIDDSANSKESQVSYGGLKLISMIAGKDK